MTSPTAPSGSDPLVSIRLEEVSGPILVLDIDFPHPLDQVWDALHEPARLALWSPHTANRDIAEPGPVTFLLYGDDDETLGMPGEVAVVEVHPESGAVLEHSWGPDALRWELTPFDGETHLRLHHRLHSIDMASSVAAGWHLCLAVLGSVLDGTPLAPIRARRALDFGWEELNARYALALGVRATSLEW